MFVMHGSIMFAGVKSVFLLDGAPPEPAPAPQVWLHPALLVRDRVAPSPCLPASLPACLGLPGTDGLSMSTATGATIPGWRTHSLLPEVNKQRLNKTIQIKFKHNMCWNFQIKRSVAAASLEACFLLLLVIRACCSSEPRDSASSCRCCQSYLQSC